MRSLFILYNLLYLIITMVLVVQSANFCSSLIDLLTCKRESFIPLAFEEGPGNICVIIMIRVTVKRSSLQNTRSLHYYIDQDAGYGEVKSVSLQRVIKYDTDIKR